MEAHTKAVHGSAPPSMAAAATSRATTNVSSSGAGTGVAAVRDSVARGLAAVRDSVARDLVAFFRNQSPEDGRVFFKPAELGAFYSSHPAHNPIRRATGVSLRGLAQLCPQLLAWIEAESEAETKVEVLEFRDPAEALRESLNVWFKARAGSGSAKDEYAATAKPAKGGRAAAHAYVEHGPEHAAAWVASLKSRAAGRAGSFSPSFTAVGGWRQPLEAKIAKLQGSLMTASDMETREQVRSGLQAHIRQYVAGVETVEVKTFGSTVSGLAGKDSDIDMVAVWPGAKQVAAKPFLQDAIKNVILQRWGLYFQCRPILAAKVPIVQFRDVATQLDCDLCVGNALAIANSQLLKEYCNFDGRFKALAWVVKKWAKFYDLNDNKSGTFSSYALTIMAVHFCQEQGILPCLQYSNRPAEGAAISHFETAADYKTRTAATLAAPALPSPLATAEPPATAPDERTTLDLWFGWLEYYSAFDFSSKDVSIAPPNPAAGYRNRRTMQDRSDVVVHDPFDALHNLTRGVQRTGSERFKLQLAASKRAMTALAEDPGSPSREWIESDNVLDDLFRTSARCIPGSRATTSTSGGAAAAAPCAQMGFVHTAAPTPSAPQSTPLDWPSLTA